MKKYIFLTAIISITLSILTTLSISQVFSWEEPDGVMPSGYEEPITTSQEFQSKEGDLSVPNLYDFNNQAYYINPSGISNISSLLVSNLITQNGNITTSSPMSTVATLQYVQDEISDLLSGNVQFYWITGSQCSCNTGDFFVLRNWEAETFDSPYAPNNYPVSCTTVEALSSLPPICATSDQDIGGSWQKLDALHSATKWNAALCGKVL